MSRKCSPLPVFDVPLATALTMKDMAMQSDTDHQVFYSRNSARDCVQMPRLHYVKKQRVALNKTVKRLVGLKVLLDDLSPKPRVVLDLMKLVVLRVQHYIATGHLPSTLVGLNELLFKLTRDATDNGGRTMTVGSLVNISLAALVGGPLQSYRNVDHIALAWASESVEGMLNLVPELTEQVARICTPEGISIPTPAGYPPLIVKVDIHAGADYHTCAQSFPEIGSASANSFCMYCNVTKLNRHLTGNDEWDLSVLANWRRSANGELLKSFGIPTTKFHLCGLHCNCRVTEKLLNMLYTAGFVIRKEIEDEIASLKAAVMSAKKRARQAKVKEKKLKARDKMKAGALKKKAKAAALRRARTTKRKDEVEVRSVDDEEDDDDHDDDEDDEESDDEDDIGGVCVFLKCLKMP